MKAQRRHDLKTNTLAEQLAAAIDWTKQNSTYFTVGLVAAAVAIGGVTWYRYNDRVTRERGWLELASNSFLMPMAAHQGSDETQISRLRQLAVIQGRGPLAASAWNALGDLLTAQAMSAPSAGTQAGSAIHRWQDAKEAYESALQAAGNEAVPAAAARLGLAIASESLAALGSLPDGFDVAEKQYQAIVTDKRLENSPLEATAQKRQQALGGLREPIVFAPSTQPAEKEETQATDESLARPAAGQKTATRPKVSARKAPLVPSTRGG